MRFLPEPAFAHDRPRRIGVLLINLGTPDAPTAAAVRTYLAEFLSDPRVIEIPRAAWLPVLHGVILRLRPAQSARKYATIWSKDGSPLLVHSLRQKTLLQGYLGQRMKALGLPSDYAQIELGMRYGRPTIADAMARLKAAGCDRVLVLPLYPQYAASTTASALDAVFAAASQMRAMPALRVVAPYHDDPAYIKAVAQSINDYWVKNGRPDKLVLSFHGVPRRSLDLGDPVSLSLPQDRAAGGRRARPQQRRNTRSRSSRGSAGPAGSSPIRCRRCSRWQRRGCAGSISPVPALPAIASKRWRSWGTALRSLFSGPAARSCTAYPASTSRPDWIATLAELATRNLQGWLDAPADAVAREMTQARAKALGADR